MSVQCESMNSSTTARPAKPDRETVRPAWSVRVNAGAGWDGTGDSCMSVASGVGTAAGTPGGRTGSA